MRYSERMNAKSGVGPKYIAAPVVAMIAAMMLFVGAIIGIVLVIIGLAIHA